MLGNGHGNGPASGSRARRRPQSRRLRDRRADDPLDHPAARLGAWVNLLFLVLAGGLLGCALLVVLSRDIIRCGLWMILCFLFLAGLYVLLGNPLWVGGPSCTFAPSAC